MSAATLDERSGGRILLGLGPSGANVIEHWHGVRFEKPLKRTREYVEILRMIFREEKLVYHGEYFNLERGFKLRFKPLRPDIPIYIAAMGPKNLVQSGEIADGVLPVYWPANKWGEMRALLDEGEHLAGRPAHSTLIAPYITSVLLPETVSEEQRKTVRLRAAAPLAYYIARMGVYYADMLTRNGFGEDVEAVKEADKRGGTRAAAAAVSDRMLDATSIIGTPKEFVAKLDTWGEAGVDEPLLAMPDGLVDEAALQLSSLMDALKQY
jgi:alkanesulfonate monooxygenase SsuD/methylene tetrahydromethanopterin reductase-like flavin-dependent oxidoreductase (luciferase family)